MSRAALALTGGGALARFSLAFLVALKSARAHSHGPGARIAGAFDLLAGTSGGALVAAGLAAGRSAADMAALFDRHAPLIFAHSRWRSLRQIWRPKHDMAPLRRAIAEGLGGDGLRFGDLPHPLAVAALDEETGTPRVFSALDPAMAGRAVAPVVAASCAAPTYFPAVMVDGRRHVDGGLFANAPDLLAFAQLRRAFPGTEPAAIRLLSIGATHANRLSTSAPGNAGAWGLVGWSIRPAAHLLRLVLAAQVDATVHQIMPQMGLLTNRRIDAVLDGAEIDDASPATRARLIAAAQAQWDRRSQDAALARDLAQFAQRQRAP